MRLHAAPLNVVPLLVVQLFVLLTNRSSKAAQVKGNPYAVIVVTSARTSTNNPLHSQENVTLWCQVGLFSQSLQFKE